MSKKIPLLTSEERQVLLPEIPGYIYTCIDNKPEDMAALQALVAAEKMLLDKPTEDVRDLIRSWPYNIDLTSQFEFRAPTKSEWGKLCECQYDNKSFPALVKKHESSFIFSHLNYRTAELCKNITDWNAWSERTPHLSVDEYLSYLECFNFVEHHPKLAIYKRAFHRDLSAITELAKVTTDKSPHWYLNNPYLSENEQDSWHVFISDHVKLPSSLLLPLIYKGLIPPQSIDPTLILKDYSRECDKVLIKLLSNNVEFRTKLILTLFEVKNQSTSYDKHFECLIPYSNTTFQTALICVEKNWVPTELLLPVLSTLGGNQISKYCAALVKVHPNIIENSFSWDLLYNKNSVNGFVTSQPATVLLKLSPSINHLLTHYSSSKDPLLLPSLSKASRVELLSLTLDEMFLFLSIPHTAIVPYDILERFINSLCDVPRAVRLWRLWLGTIRNKIPQREYKALIMHIVRTFPEHSTLGQRHPELMKRVKSVVV